MEERDERMRGVQGAGIVSQRTESLSHFALSKGDKRNINDSYPSGASFLHIIILNLSPDCTDSKIAIVVSIKLKENILSRKNICQHSLIFQCGCIFLSLEDEKMITEFVLKK